MRVVPRDDGLGAYSPQELEANLADHLSPDINLRTDAMRSWLVSGIHLFAVDSRRRFGGHGRARLLLVDDMRAKLGSSERWHALASALRRHAVRGGLAHLSPEERRVITLAYLGGRTNREIAIALGVSVSTVRRRLWTALERLETYMSRTGAWLNVIVLVVVGYVLGGGARLGRSAGNVASAAGMQTLATTFAVGSVTAVALGMVAITSDTATPGKSPPAATARLIPSISGVPQLSSPADPGKVMPVRDRQGGGGPTDEGTQEGPDGTAPQAGSLRRNQRCDGNPTNAPPRLPAGSHSSHPTGAPVTHPTAGGCST